MASFNNITIVGNLTADVELRNTNGGEPVGNFRVAVNGYKEGEVSFIPVVVWSKLAAVCSENIGKGSSVLVSGELRQENWESREGEKRNRLVINARTVQFLGAKGSREAVPEERDRDAWASPTEPDDGADMVGGSSFPF